MMRLTRLFCRAFTAFAIARYVLPVPAGPMPKTMVCLSIASTYRFWLTVFGRMVRPREDRMSRDRTSAGRSVAIRSMWMLRSTASGDSSAPEPTNSISSSKRRTTTPLSSGLPVMVISLPRTWMSALKAPSMTRRSSSPDPRRLTIGCPSGMTTLAWVWLMCCDSDMGGPCGPDRLLGSL